MKRLIGLAVVVVLLIAAMWFAGWDIYRARSSPPTPRQKKAALTPQPASHGGAHNQQGAYLMTTTITTECTCGSRCRRCGRNGLAHVNPRRARHDLRRAVRRGAVIA